MARHALSWLGDRLTTAVANDLVQRWRTDGGRDRDSLALMGFKPGDVPDDAAEAFIRVQNRVSDLLDGLDPAASAGMLAALGRSGAGIGRTTLGMIVLTGTDAAVALHLAWLLRTEAGNPFQPTPAAVGIIIAEGPMKRRMLAMDASAWPNGDLLCETPMSADAAWRSGDIVLDRMLPHTVRTSLAQQPLERCIVHPLLDGRGWSTTTVEAAPDRRGTIIGTDVVEEMVRLPALDPASTRPAPGTNDGALRRGPRTGITAQVKM